MLLFFLVLVVIHVAGALLSVLFGYLSGPQSLSWHLIIGLLTALEGILLHCLFLFFFTGTGSWVRKNVPDSLREKPELMKRVAGFRRRLFPLLLFSILLWMVTTTAGGAASVLWLPNWLHGLVALVSTLVSFWTCRRGVALLRENLAMLKAVESLLGEDRAPEAS